MFGETQLYNKICSGDNEVCKRVLDLLLNDINISFGNSDHGNENVEHSVFEDLTRSVLWLMSSLELIKNSLSIFDFRNVKANGFRSIVLMSERSLLHLENDLLILNKTFMIKKFLTIEQRQMLSYYVELYSALYFIVDSALELLEAAVERANGNVHQLSMEKQFLLMCDPSDPINIIYRFCSVFVDRAFYGRHIGFQYAKGIDLALTGLSYVMGIYYDSKIDNNSSFKTMVRSVGVTSKFVKSIDEKAKVVETLLKNPSTDFVKAFWNLIDSPMYMGLTSFFIPRVMISRDINIPVMRQRAINIHDPLLDKLYMPITNKKTVQIRYFSDDVYIGLCNDDLIMRKSDFIFNLTTNPKNSDGIIFHIPGGGFISQTPKSHQSYLKRWCKLLKMPIISVDYSKAPQNSFPLAVEECFLVYSWVVTYCKKFGWSGKTIVLTGDSAGGNLCAAVVERAIQNGIRIPDGVVLSYPCLYVRPIMSPSRLLCMSEVLLSSKILQSCLGSYVSKDVTKYNEEYFHNVCRELCIDASTVLAHKSVPLAEEFKEKIDKLHKTFENVEKLKYGSENFMKKRLEAYEELKKLVHELRKLPTYESKGVFNLSKFFYNDFWNEFMDTLSLSPTLSPILAPDNVLKKFPKTTIVVSDADPLLDECIEFCKILDKNSVIVNLKVVQALPHGFLQFQHTSKKAEDAVNFVMESVREFFV